MMIKVAVCDDEPTMLDYLCENISAEFKRQGIEICLNKYLSGELFLNAHKSDPFDVIFLDIVMQKMNGFDVAKEMRSTFQKTYIIFVTTESSLVYESFDFQPFYFIPKGSPKILAERLSHVVKRLAVHLSANKRIILKASYSDEYSVDPLNILSAESSTKYVLYRFADREPLKIRQKLDNAGAELNPYLFVRIHNRFIVNMKHIKKIDYPNLEVTMNDGRTLNISSSCKKELEKQYDIYLRNFE